MSLSAEQIAAARDLFSGLGDITTMRMMGGLCLHHRGTIFAIVMGDGGIFIKASGDMIATLEAEGCTQWHYQRAGRAAPSYMPYWTLPDAAYDDPDTACDSARWVLAHL